ncbi:hypothetical protein FXN63_11840 [Pigmentiphaga aceris]|uniref:Lipoprotein n=1 Tax=Pigmentiphaga aceris TaxID=1940612 RepID=A0A5C0AW37_9BURK|nr:hypothetical protein [Pigmentiphaga aceris]QEI06445.1 hypothetical protein FXN63_11840 [Pigmentiphaga aceris]
MTHIRRAITLGSIPALAVLVLSGCAAPTPTMTSVTDQMAAREQQRQAAEKSMTEATDQLLSGAIQAGKAIVVTTTVNLDSQQWGDLSNADVSAEFARQRHGITEWRNVDNPAHNFKVGNGQSAIEIKSVKGSHMQVTFGRTLYQVFVVEPGNYTLAGGSNAMPRTVLANPAANAKIRPSALGTVVMDETTFTEYGRGQVWRDATYRTDRVKQTVCTAVRVASGQCASTADASYDQVTQTSAAGYASTTTAKEVPGVWAFVSLRKPFASFSVAKGEVVLVDGFYGDAPTASFTDKDCERVASTKVSCELNKFTMIRIPTSLQDFSKTTPAAELGLPATGEVLKRIQYREPKIFARPGSTNSTRWGQEYALTGR